MKKEIKKEKEQFEYRDVDYLELPIGWLEAKLVNRLREGFEIWRDYKNMSWKGKKKFSQLKPN